MNDRRHQPAALRDTILKTRLIDAHRQEFAAGLEWAAEDPMRRGGGRADHGARRRFVLGAATSFTYASLLAAKLSDSLAKVTLVDGTIVRPARHLVGRTRSTS